MRSLPTTQAGIWEKYPFPIRPLYDYILYIIIILFYTIVDNRHRDVIWKIRYLHFNALVGTYCLPICQNAFWTRVFMLNERRGLYVKVPLCFSIHTFCEHKSFWRLPLDTLFWSHNITYVINDTFHIIAHLNTYCKLLFQ